MLLLILEGQAEHDDREEEVKKRRSRTSTSSSAIIFKMAEFHQLRSLKADDDDDDVEDEDGGGDGRLRLRRRRQLWAAWESEAENLARREPSAELPSLDHLRMSDYDAVYEPADDTYLLVDALRYELNNNNNNTPSSTFLQERWNHRNRPYLTILEIGCGTGVPSVFFRMEWSRTMARRMRMQEQQEHQGQQDNESSSDDREPPTTSPPSPALLSYATDVNPEALRVARETAEANLGCGCGCGNGNGNGRGDGDFFFELVRCDLASALLPRLRGQVDVLIFNPPYVPTPDEEVYGCGSGGGNSGGIEASWAGGKDGRAVVDRSVEQLGRLLRRPTGVGYLVTVDDNRPLDLAEKFRREAELDMRPLFRRKARNEHLTVQKLTCAVPEDDDDEGEGEGEGEQTP